MLRQVADGVRVHQSELLQNNSVVVQGRAGVLLIDPGMTGDEMACLANDLRQSGQPVVAGFSTHPDWDHVLWYAELGEAPRYGTARCAAFVRDLLSNADWKARVAEGLPPEIAEDIPLELFGVITGLPAETAQVPWDGPDVRIVEQPAHAQGHAALLIEERGVLVAGDMLSDILMPFPDLDAADPIEDYLMGLRRLEDVADGVEVLIPGHGSVAGAGELRTRIELDRAYVYALRDDHVPDDPRIGPAASYGQDWLPGVYEWQRQQLAHEASERGCPASDHGDGGPLGSLQAMSRVVAARHPRDCRCAGGERTRASACVRRARLIRRDRGRTPARPGTGPRSRLYR
jgi:glyoxylase-like metal-dependent hydrolase (beta-lactamase superfamily II)